MKREGPCWHCGIAYTPLWRSGPTEKPVLCNACGSRWRLRGTLADYVPKHATKHNQATKPSHGAEETKPYFSFGCFEDDTTNRSGSSSTSSETCVRTENINGLDEFKIWDKESIPRRKRFVLNQWVLSPVERLHKDLQLMYQQQLFEQPEEEEDELIYENTTNSFSSLPETAYGAMLLKSPNFETTENKRADLGKEKETKPESPMSPISLEQISSKNIPPTNQVAQEYERPPCVRKRGRPRKGTKQCAGPKCTTSRDESANGGKDVYIHALHPSEVRDVSPTERNRGRQLHDNQTLEGTSAISFTWVGKRD